MNDNYFVLVINHLKGRKLAHIESELRIDELTRDKFKRVSLTDANGHYVDEILRRLNIVDEHKITDYKAENNNLYSLLLHLRRDEHHHLESLICLIQQTRKQRLFSSRLLGTLFLGVLTGAGALFAHFQNERFLRFVALLKSWGISSLKWLKHTFSLVRNVALFNLVFNLLKTSFHLYKIATNETLSKNKMLGRLFFALLQGALTAAAYAATLAYNGMINAISAPLFVLVSLVDVIKGSLSYYRNYHRKQASDEGELGKSWASHAEVVRKSSYSLQHKNSLIIKIVAAVFNTLTVTAWCLLPGSLVLTAACTGAFMIIGSLRQLALDSVKERHQTRLQTNLAELSKYENLNSSYQHAERMFGKSYQGEVISKSGKRIIISRRLGQANLGNTHDEPVDEDELRSELQVTLPQGISQVTLKISQSARDTRCAFVEAEGQASAPELATKNDDATPELVAGPSPLQQAS